MYRLGFHRIFYQSPHVNQQELTAIVLTPLLETKGPFALTYISDGLYYLDVTFRRLGSHVFSIYSGADCEAKKILVVEPGELSIIYPREAIL